MLHIEYFKCIAKHILETCSNNKCVLKKGAKMKYLYNTGRLLHLQK